MKIILGTALVALGTAVTALSMPIAVALPGQCWQSPFGGFCDSAPMSDGSYQNCVSYGSSSYCQQVCHDYNTNRAVPTDMDPSTPC